MQLRRLCLITEAVTRVRDEVGGELVLLPLSAQLQGSVMDEAAELAQEATELRIELRGSLQVVARSPRFGPWRLS